MSLQLALAFWMYTRNTMEMFKLVDIYLPLRSYIIISFSKFISSYKVKKLFWVVKAAYVSYVMLCSVCVQCRAEITQSVLQIKMINRWSCCSVLTPTLRVLNAPLVIVLSPVDLTFFFLSHHLYLPNEYKRQLELSEM